MLIKFLKFHTWPVQINFEIIVIIWFYPIQVVFQTCSSALFSSHKYIFAVCSMCIWYFQDIGLLVTSVLCSHTQNGYCMTIINVTLKLKTILKVITSILPSREVS